MPQFKKIIVATDFSEPSIEALREADRLAQGMDSEVFVFHAVPNLVRANPLFPHKNIEDVFQLPAMMDRAADAVDELIAKHMRSDHTNVHVLVDTGWPDTALMRKAEEIGADLIVVGSRGFTGLKHVLLGSVAERVIRYSHCAVMVARASPSGGRILAATDFSDPALPAIDAAVQIAKRRGAELTVMHSLGVRSSSLSWAASPFGGGPIVPDEQAIRDARIAATQLIETSLGEFGAVGSAFVGDGMPEDDILRKATVLPADMIVLGSQGRTAINRVALGSVAETVARTATCSVLVIRLATA
jgi:nucleotide-binding universal stress UspA family protein